MRSEDVFQKVSVLNFSAASETNVNSRLPLTKKHLCAFLPYIPWGARPIFLGDKGFFQVVELVALTPRTKNVILAGFQSAHPNT